MTHPGTFLAGAIDCGERVVPLRGFEPLTPSLRMIKLPIYGGLGWSINIRKTVIIYPHAYAAFRQCLTPNVT